MKIFIFGFDHDLQRQKSWLDGTEKRAKKTKYENLVNRIINDYGVDFIAEEEFPGNRTLISELAEARNIRWEPVEMPLSEREARGIAEEQRNRPSDMSFDGEKLTQIQHRVASDVVREEHMFNKTLATMNSASSVLLLCGMIHLNALVERFTTAGHQVVSDSLANCDWY